MECILFTQTSVLIVIVLVWHVLVALRQTVQNVSKIVFQLMGFVLNVVIVMYAKHVMVFIVLLVVQDVIIVRLKRIVLIVCPNVKRVLMERLVLLVKRAISLLMMGESLCVDRVRNKLIVSVIQLEVMM